MPVLAEMSFGTGIVVVIVLLLVAGGAYLFARKKGWV